MNELVVWFKDRYDVGEDTIIDALEMSPSAQGYIHGAVSELMLIAYLSNKGFEVRRIKEKPAGGYTNKKVGYKGDFLINKKGSKDYYVVECKGIKTNAEFRVAETDSNDFSKKLTEKQAISYLSKFVKPNIAKTYDSGKNRYEKAKNEWESKNPGKKFPAFRWPKANPGPDNVDLTAYFNSKKDVATFVKNADPKKLEEKSFRDGTGLYKILMTHQPSSRVDSVTKIKQAAPLVSDFSMMAVDLFQRTGKHEFVFMNPKKISHSPSSPNHLYQNYTIDVIIPGIKDDVVVKEPWYSDIDDCILKTKPTKVKYDESQLDHR